MSCRMAALGIPRFATPVFGGGRRWIIVSLPPNRPIGSQRDVGKDRVFLDGLHRVQISLRSGSRRNAEKSSFWIDSPKSPIGTDAQPGNVVADGVDLPSFHARRRHQHG